MATCGTLWDNLNGTSSNYNKWMIFQQAMFDYGRVPQLYEAETSSSPSIATSKTYTFFPPDCEIKTSTLRPDHALYCDGW